MCRILPIDENEENLNMTGNKARNWHATDIFILNFCIYFKKMRMNTIKNILNLALNADSGKVINLQSQVNKCRKYLHTNLYGHHQT